MGIWMQINTKAMDMNQINDLLNTSEDEIQVINMSGHTCKGRISSMRLYTIIGAMSDNSVRSGMRFIIRDNYNGIFCVNSGWFQFMRYVPNDNEVINE